MVAIRGTAGASSGTSSVTTATPAITTAGTWSNSVIPQTGDIVMISLGFQTTNTSATITNTTSGGATWNVSATTHNSTSPGLASAFIWAVWNASFTNPTFTISVAGGVMAWEAIVISPSSNSVLFLDAQAAVKSITTTTTSLTTNSATAAASGEIGCLFGVVCATTTHVNVSISAQPSGYTESSSANTPGVGANGIMALAGYNTGIASGSNTPGATTASTSCIGQMYFVIVREMLSLPVIFAVGTLIKSSASANATLSSFIANYIGDCVVLSVKIASTTPHVSTVSGGGCTTWTKLAGPTADTNATPHNHEFWLGTVTSQTTQNITLTYSSSVTGITIDLSAQEFSSGDTGAVWSVDVSGFQNNGTASTTVTYPSLTPTAYYGELYVGHARVPSGSSYSAPLPSGFVTQTDADANPYMYGICTGSSVQPTETASSSASYAMGVLIKVQNSGTISACSAPQLTGSVGLNSFSFVTSGIGNLVIGYIEIDPSTSPKVTGLSSTNTGSWTKISQTFDADGKDYELWWAKTTAIGLATVSITFSSTPSNEVEPGFQEFESSRPYPAWSVVASGTHDYSSGTSIVYPTLNAPFSNMLYWGYGKTTATGSAGSTSGFAYQQVPVFLNVACWNNNVKAGSLSPTATTTTGSGFTEAAIISDGPPRSGLLDIMLWKISILLLIHL